ncbi:hypothetical protein VUR80DRAFT_356 [Thermomyces stellatus]
MRLPGAREDQGRPGETSAIRGLYRGWGHLDGTGPQRNTPQISPVINMSRPHRSGRGGRMPSLHRYIHLPSMTPSRFKRTRREEHPPRWPRSNLAVAPQLPDATLWRAIFLATASFHGPAGETGEPGPSRPRPLAGATPVGHLLFWVGEGPLSPWPMTGGT